MAKVLVVIKDGWGYRDDPQDNVVAQAKTPFYDSLIQNYPFTTACASGVSVGLPPQTQGNSEVGHTTIGAGRILDQPLTVINTSIADGTFYTNDAFLKAIDYARTNNTPLHLMGLLQDEGVHAHIDHLFALLEICRREHFTNVLIHAMTDGRDSLPHKSAELVKRLQDKLDELQFGSIASLCGRYWGMDRNKDWEVTKKATCAIRDGDCTERFSDPLVCIQDAYKHGEQDELLEPKIQTNYYGICENAAVIFWNFRTDRARQLTQSFLETTCPITDSGTHTLFFVAMTQYYDDIGLKAVVAFPEHVVTNTLSQVVSEAGLSQLKITETVKYAHVTFFFNNGIEEPWPKEERILVQTPALKTHEHTPEMHAQDITNQAITYMREHNPHLVVVNYPNPDMVGHSGNVDATVRAVEITDQYSEQLTTDALALGYVVLMTADHGNIEDMGAIWRNSHTLNPVPVHLVARDHNFKDISLRTDCELRDIAPTVLEILGIPVPQEMTGVSMIQHVPTDTTS